MRRVFLRTCSLTTIWGSSGRRQAVDSPWKTETTGEATASPGALGTGPRLAGELCPSQSSNPDGLPDRPSRALRSGERLLCCPLASVQGRSLQRASVPSSPPHPSHGAAALPGSRSPPGTVNPAGAPTSRARPRSWTPRQGRESLSRGSPAGT